MTQSRRSCNRKRKTFACTDLGNAERLVRDHGRDIRYCHDLYQWYVWDGIRWACDTTGELQRRAKDTVVGIFAEAASAKNDERRKTLASWAIYSQSERAINAMIRLAQSEPRVPITPAEMDANPFQLNVINGTIDLRTGKLNRHRREDYITKLALVTYDSKARDDVWDKFLNDLTGHDAELKEHLHGAAGYSVTGDTSEEKLFMVYGPAASGKSTFVEAIKATMGDYAKTADFETFLKRSNVGGPRNDIARLAGSRFVASVEVDQGQKLAEGLVKMITGGDTVAARKLYREAFEFRPPFKIWLAANHRPHISADDDAMWRRIVCLPADHQVPLNERDTRVKAHLTNPAAAGSAILRWLVTGCLAWQRDGLRVPAVVKAATDSYRVSQDSFNDFVSECCELRADAWVSTKDLRDEYDTWSSERGDTWVNSESLGGKDFADKLRVLGLFPKKGTGGVRGWAGIRLDNSAPPSPARPADDSQGDTVH